MSIFLPETIEAIRETLNEVRGKLSAEDSAKIQASIKRGVEYRRQEKTAKTAAEVEELVRLRAAESLNVKLILWAVVKERANRAEEVFWQTVADLLTRGVIAFTVA